jgi:hypothetical protein
MTSRTRAICGWIPAILVGLFMILASGLPKFFITPGSELAAAVEPLGVMNILIPVGIMEILFSILFLIPRTSTIGFILLVSLLGGAMATGLTHDAPGNWPFFPLVIIALATLSAYFRNPELLSRVLGRPVPEKI